MLVFDEDDELSQHHNFYRLNPEGIVDEELNEDEGMTQDTFNNNQHQKHQKPFSEDTDEEAFLNDTDENAADSSSASQKAMKK